MMFSFRDIDNQHGRELGCQDAVRIEDNFSLSFPPVVMELHLHVTNESQSAQLSAHTYDWMQGRELVFASSPDKSMLVLQETVIAVSGAIGQQHVGPGCALNVVVDHTWPAGRSTALSITARAVHKDLRPFSDQYHGALKASHRMPTGTSDSLTRESQSPLAFFLPRQPLLLQAKQLLQSAIEEIGNMPMSFGTNSASFFCQVTGTTEGAYHIGRADFNKFPSNRKKGPILTNLLHTIPSNFPSFPHFPPSAPVCPPIAPHFSLPWVRYGSVAGFTCHLVWVLPRPDSAPAVTNCCQSNDTSNQEMVSGVCYWPQLPLLIAAARQLVTALCDEARLSRTVFFPSLRTVLRVCVVIASMLTIMADCTII